MNRIELGPWVKATRSAGARACVEMAPAWQKAKRSHVANCVEMTHAWQKPNDCVSGDCVEAAGMKAAACNPSACVEVDDLVTRDGSTHVAIRDSKDPEGPILLFTPEEFGAFLAEIREGDHDLEVEVVNIFSADSAAGAE